MMENNNTFFSYQGTSFENAKLGLLEFQKRISILNYFEDDLPFWFGLQEAIYGFQSINLDPLFVKFVSLVDLGNLKKMIIVAEKWQVAINSGLSKDQKINSEPFEYQPQIFTKECQDLKIKLGVFSLWQKVFTNLDKDGQNKLWQIWREFVEIARDVGEELDMIFAFLGLNNFKEFYTKEELISILNGKVDAVRLDLVRLSKTFGVYFNDEDGREVAIAVYDHLRDPDIFEIKGYSWIDNFLMTIFLHFVFKYFKQFDLTRQKFLISYYLFKAMVANVPVRYELRRSLYYDTKDVSSFVLLNFDYYKALLNNKEELNFGADKKYTLGELFKLGMSTLGERFKNPYDRDAFLNGLVENIPDKNIWVKSLRESFYVFSHIKTADLIDQNIGSEPSGKETFEHQLTHLLSWWLDEDFWPLFDKFYNDEKSAELRMVPLKSVFREIRLNEDITNEKISEKLIKFSDYLKSIGLLPKDEDILVYDETKDSFVWNENLTI